jgi:hypothetical protein
MSKIEKFLAKPQEVEIGGEKYMLKPFTVNDMSMMTRMGSKDENIQSKAIQEAIFKIMKQIDSEATQEQVNDVSIQFLEEIMNAISKINNLDVDEAKAKLIQRLKQ